VVCFHFPEYFTTPEFRSHYPVEVLRYVLLACLTGAFGFALASFVLGRRAGLPLAGVLLSALAVLLGGTAVEVRDFDQSTFNISLDWLLIDILVLSAVFVPIELFAPKRRDQSKFHREWKTDLVYFAVGHLLVQYTAVAVRYPAETLFGRLGLGATQAAVKDWPFAVQLLMAMVLADIFQYAAHRAFHANRVLWRFHAVHHSIRAVDWLAGSRLHLVDVVVTRAFAYIPLYVSGVSMAVFYAYVAIVAFQAVAAHANTAIPFGWLKYVVVTPQYHHWHHSDDPSVYNTNFAIHFPLIDRLFGTYYLPGDRWPESTGVDLESFPRGYLRQFVYPFSADPADAPPLESGRR
jgi:lathosterol oxidase